MTKEDELEARVRALEQEQARSEERHKNIMVRLDEIKGLVLSNVAVAKTVGQIEQFLKPLGYNGTDSSKTIEKRVSKMEWMIYGVLGVMLPVSIWSMIELVKTGVGWLTHSTIPPGP